MEFVGHLVQLLIAHQSLLLLLLQLFGGSLFVTFVFFIKLRLHQSPQSLLGRDCTRSAAGEVVVVVVAVVVTTAVTRGRRDGGQRSASQ